MENRPWSQSVLVAMAANMEARNPKLESRCSLAFSCVGRALIGFLRFTAFDLRLSAFICAPGLSRRSLKWTVLIVDGKANLCPDCGWNRRGLLTRPNSGRNYHMHRAQINSHLFHHLAFMRCGGQCPIDPAAGVPVRRSEPRRMSMSGAERKQLVPDHETQQGRSRPGAGRKVGWYQIAPPPGSFSFVDMAMVDRPAAPRRAPSQDKVYIRRQSA
jgi:hypothetical protein